MYLSMKKNRKILLAGGDSFTEHTCVSYRDSSLITDFPRWPVKLAEKLNMEYVNLGKSACTNEFISTSIYEYLMENPKKEIGLVCCLWADYTRISLYNMPNWPTMIGSRLFSSSLKSFDKNESMWLQGPDKFLDLLYYYTKNTNTKAETIVENIIKNNIKIFHDLECMLSLRNIPYLYLQGVFPFSDTDEFRRQVRKKMPFKSDPNLLNNRGLEKIYAPPIKQLLFYLLKYEKYFNKEKFIGWPGLNLKNNDISSFWYDEPAKNVISKDDLHPNEKGHQIIANHFYKKTEELYSHLL
jgi:hypothetical protein